MVKTIIFDSGGVLLFPNFQNFYKNHFKDKNVSKRERELRHKMDRSSIDLEEYLKTLEKEFGIPCQKENYIKSLRSFATENKTLFTIIKSQLKKESNIYLFSNNSPLYIDKTTKEKYKSYFKEQIYSFEIGVSKPDQKAYQILLSKIVSKPKDCLFIDDKLKNLIPAKKLGINTHLYKTNSALQKGLYNFLSL